MINLAIFASGSGTNAENICKYFQNYPDIKIKFILTNNPTAGVIIRSRRLNVESVVFNRDTFYKTNDIISLLKSNKIDLIILSGFLWLIPENLINEFPDRIINIHPALLPKYGGKGMYGMNVHNAVINNNEKESGITIHLVNEIYDKGEILFQTKCDILNTDSPETLAHKIHLLEYEYFPKVISNFITNNIKSVGP